MKLRHLVLACVAGLSCAPALHAGAFLRGNTGAADRITHAKGYPAVSNPVGANYVVTVCLDPVTTPVQAEQSVRNAVAEFNRLQGSGNNVVTGNSQADFESMLMHELGHCMGLDHNTLGPSELATVGACDFDPMTAPPDCFASSQIFSTIALPDPTPPIVNGDAYNTDDGIDNVRGSRDDVRSDDVNRHWFRVGVNDPFAALPATVDQATYSISPASLPVGHLFAEVASSHSPCSPGAAANTSALRGQGTTGAVMMPVLCINNFVRDLSRDDEATLRIARSGYNGTAGNTDDYTWTMQYAGRTTACDIPISLVPDDQTGFAQCSVGLAIPGNGSGDAVITSGNIIARASIAWFYNQTDTTGSPGAGTCIFRSGFENTPPTCN